MGRPAPRGGLCAEDRPAAPEQPDSSLGWDPASPCAWDPPPDTHFDRPNVGGGTAFRAPTEPIWGTSGTAGKCRQGDLRLSPVSQNSSGHAMREGGSQRQWKITQCALQPPRAKLILAYAFGRDAIETLSRDSVPELRSSGTIRNQCHGPNTSRLTPPHWTTLPCLPVLLSATVGPTKH